MEPMVNSGIELKKVTIGSHVTVQFRGEKKSKKYEVVKKGRTTLEKGMITEESPLGSSLIDGLQGEERRFKVDIQEPWISYVIISVE